MQSRRLNDKDLSFDSEHESVWVSNIESCCKNKFELNANESEII